MAHVRSHAVTSAGETATGYISSAHTIPKMPCLPWLSSFALCCRGDEPQQLRQFKDALSLDNTAAAEVHMNLARRFLRERAEAGSRSQDSEQRKALGKLVYVSYVLFGAQQAAFLMPLRRVFNIQPASIDVMRRDNAKALFNNYIKAHGGELQVCYSPHTPNEWLCQFCAQLQYAHETAVNGACGS